MRHGILLFASQRYNGILLGRAAGGYDTRDKGKSHADGHKNYSVAYGKYCIEITDTGKCVKYEINGNAQQVGDYHAKQAGREADYHGLSIEHTGNVSLGSSYSAQ